MNMNCILPKGLVNIFLWTSAIIFSNAGYSQSVISVSINANGDDIEEYRSTKELQDGSSDLEMVTEGDQQLIGLRFTKISIPQGAVIKKAYIQFKADEANAEATTLVIKAEASPNAVAFDTAHKVSSRILLSDSITWANIPAWTVDARGAAQQTPDLSSLVQALVNRNDWARNNAMSFVVTGSGKRVADAFDEAATSTKAAELVVEYVVPLTIQVPINLVTDDLEEYVTNNIGTFDVGSSDLEMTTEGKGKQIIGLRFNNINIPKGATINSAKIQFKADESNSEATTLVVKAVNASNNGTFSETDKISTRVLTSDSIIWENIPAWTADDRGDAQLTPELKTLVTTVISRAAWAPNNSIAFVISGNGKRVADAMDEGGSSTRAAELIINYLGTDPNNTPAKPKYVLGNFPIAKGASWKYLQAPTEPEAGWTARKFLADTAWAFGPASLGFGVNALGTTLDETKKGRIFLRNTIKTTSSVTQFDSLVFTANVNDGAVFYINGVEVKRVNLPSGALDANTLALTNISGADITKNIRFVVANSLLINDTNTIAVVLYPAAVTPTDLSFDLDIKGKLPTLGVAKLPIRKNAVWAANDWGIDLGTSWKELNYNDGGWTPGVGVLGYGDPVATTLSYGDNAANKYPTAYFRKKFLIEDLAAINDSVYINLRRDDGAVVYINGQEVIRTNMPQGTITYNTWAATKTDGSAETTYFNYAVSKSALASGVNIIAVEVHQDTASSSDLTFDLELKNKQKSPEIATGCNGANDTHITCFTSVSPVRNQLLNVPATHAQQLIAKTGDLYNAGKPGSMGSGNDFTGFIPADMTSSTKGHLSVNQETGTYGVSMLDLHYDETTKLWVRDSMQAIDFSQVVGTAGNCSGGVTPWETVITCEETRTASDANADGYSDYGWVVEINPKTNRVADYGTGSSQKLWAVGRGSHENVVVDKDSLTLYWGEDNGSGSVYKFVADQKMNLSSGKLYALKLVSGLIANEPTATSGTWIQIPNTTVWERNNTFSIAASLGATPFNGVEDVEIGTIDHKIYFTAKGNNRTYRFKDNGNTVSDFETFVGGDSYSFVIEGGTTVTEPWGSGNDNLTFDDRGNLYVLQDGGKGHLWLVRPEHTQSNPKVELFATTPEGSESTGMTFTPDFKFMFFSLQHPSATNTKTLVDAAGKTITYNDNSTVIVARKEYLGDIVTDATDVKYTQKMQLSVYPNPSEGIIQISFGLNNTEVVKCEILNLDGTLVKQALHTFDAGQQTLQMQLTSGIYLLKVSTLKGIVTEKVIIK